ncbi:MAG TPA: glycerophosphodiester phosphodiesterase family protein [Pirellulales bacterium]|jgi:glycerophosphoryl diester phosphodiesterase
MFGLESIVVLLLLGAAVAAPAPSRFVQPAGPLARPQVVAPGGYTRQAPANTARPIELAIADGLDWVEVEVRRTKDGRHVVFDADRLDDRTSGSGAVRDHTLAEITALDAGRWFAPRFADARVLSLPQCLELVKDRIGLIIVCRDTDPEALAREIQASGVGRRALVSADDETLKRLRELSDGQIPLLARGQAGGKIKAWVAEVKPDVVSLEFKDLSAEVCRAFHELNVSVLADATREDRADRWDRATAADVDLLRTSLPEEFVVRAISQKASGRTVQYAAHRGASRYAPENTYASLDKAVRLGADYVEIDVHTTADGGFFLLHDSTLDRTTNGHGPVRKGTSEALRALDAGSWFGRPFKEAHVPELDEYLAKFPPQTQLYFDAKDISPEALAEAVSRHGLVERTIVYQGPVYLEKLRAINPKIRALPPAAAQSHVDTLAKRIAPYAVDARWNLVTREFIEHCHKLGVKVFSDAPSGLDVDGYRRAIGNGIDLIQTDHPLRLWRAIELGPLE